MRLIEKLKQRRDAALATAGKYQEMIALLEGDPSLTRGSVLRADAIADQALALHVGANGNGNGHVAKTDNRVSPAARKRMSKRMKQLWKEKRAQMLAGVRRGSKRGQKTLKARAKARKLGLPMPPSIAQRRPAEPEA